jgi:UDP-N-acetylmuramate dehydrogenase
MQIQHNISLKKYNTFSIAASAAAFAAFSTPGELAALLDQFRAQQILLLGGGSNVLLTGDVAGAVLKNEIMGIEKTGEDAEFVDIKCGGGENWHKLVMYCVAHQWAGVENLALIPGSTGAGPIQNIGAYGVELKDVFYELEAWHRGERRIVTFSGSDCGFGYRDSVFKRKYRDQFVILNVSFRLRRIPVYHTGYGAIREELEKSGVQDLSIAAIADAVCRIRRSKLPDPAQIGNAGSFFKNPAIPRAQYQELQDKFPGMAAYPQENDTVKIAAGWMIEQCGWKGYREGDTGCHPKQALVLVNYGHATGEQVLQLARKISDSVMDKFGVRIEPEVNII